MGCRPCQEAKRRQAIFEEEERQKEQQSLALKEQKKPYTIIDVAKDFISGDLEYVSQETYINRVKTCEQCPHLIPFIKMCGICNCLIKEKAKHKSSQCPDEKPDCKLPDNECAHQVRWYSEK